MLFFPPTLLSGRSDYYILLWWRSFIRILN